MEISHIWSQEVRDELLEATVECGIFARDEQDLIQQAIMRLPVDSVIVMTEAEWDLLNAEDVPLAERSDVALAFLISDLTYGPGRWIDSLKIEQEFGEWH